MTNSVVIYRGPSEYDREPIVVLLSGLAHASANRKTGALLQTYILVDTMKPTEAVRTGADASICGGCKLRNNGCYVNVGQAPQSLYGALGRATVPDVLLSDLPELAARRFVRLGSYGDPAAVPGAVWSALLAQASGHTGYTHAWRASRFQYLQQWCMASVDSDAERSLAQRLGWSTFQVRPRGDATVAVDQSRCLASAEAGHLTTCEQCMICGGNSRGQTHVVIQAHGSKAKRILEVV